jgi:phosphonate transport system substrate-binding protein
LKIGLAPSFRLAVIRDELRPFLAHLEQRLGRRLEPVVDRSYEDQRQQLRRGGLDLAVLHHMQVVFLRQASSTPTIVAAMSYRGSTTYRSVLVVRDNAGIGRVEQLAGRRICWVNRGSASGYLVPRLFLRKKGLDPDTAFEQVRFTGDHYTALKDLISGLCDAAATTAGWLELGPKRGLATSRVRILATTGRIPLDYVCASSKLPDRLVRRVRRALLEFKPQRDIGRRIIGPSFLADGFAMPRSRDLETIIRAMRLEGIAPSQ